MVFVINKDGKPLMPCSIVIARLLLKDKKAKCIRRTPFTIKLLYETSNYTQDLTLGIDTGSDKIGSAVVNQKNEVVYTSEVQVRNDIAKKMDRRRQYRRTRRNRKTRYRKPRWQNRGNSKKEGRFSPTMVSKINSHIKEIEFVKSVLPITKLIIETGQFDPHALKNPKVKQYGWMYQKGTNYGFANTRAYVLFRDDYTCQCCKGKSGVKKLEVHNIIYKCNGGSDDPKNLITLCKKCHDAVHKGKIELTKGEVKGQLKHATQMNSIRLQLLKHYEDAIETFGYITKEHRWILGLTKEHYIDAIVIASEGSPITLLNNQLLLKRCVPKGDYQQTKGVRSQQKIPTGKIRGFRKFDKVKYLGKEYFIKGRRSVGNAVLMDIQNNTIEFDHAPRGWKTPKMENMKRLSARDSWMMIQATIPSAA